MVLLKVLNGLNPRKILNKRYRNCGTTELVTSTNKNDIRLTSSFRFCLLLLVVPGIQQLKLSSLLEVRSTRSTAGDFRNIESWHRCILVGVGSSRFGEGSLLNWETWFPVALAVIISDLPCRLNLSHQGFESLPTSIEQVGSWISLNTTVYCWHTEILQDWKRHHGRR